MPGTNAERAQRTGHRRSRLARLILDKAHRPSLPQVEPVRLPDAAAKTRLFTVLTIVSNVAGNAFLTRGMHDLGDVGNSPLALIAALFHPLVAIGVVLLIVWTLTHMALLSWADLSYVMPVTAASYVVTAFAARIFLHEVVSPSRWLGIVLVTAGVTLVGRTAASTIK
jgi:drug/metabolite transporter (DMT)-like permease